MNSRSRYLYLLAIPLLAAGCAVGERRDTTIERKWPSAGIHQVDVREIDGSVSVEAGQGDQISLVAHVSSRGVAPKKNAENQGYFESRVDGDTLSIGRHNAHHGVIIGFPFFNRNSVSVDYTLRVPSTVGLELRTVNGRIATHGVNGESTLVTVNGTIDTESDGTSELEAKTVNGSVKARFLQSFQGAHLKTVNGRVEATLPRSASFACNLSQVNGDFEASFPLSIHSNPGSRRVSGDVNGGLHELRIVTVNGDIQLDNGTAPPAPSAPPVPAATTPVAPAAPGEVPAVPPVPAQPAPRA